MTKRTVWPRIILQRSTRGNTFRRQIEDQLASAIRDGDLPNGSRLPSSRSLAKVLGVSRGTVVDAYESLLGAGALITTARTGTRVASGTPNVSIRGDLHRTAVAAHYPMRVCFLDDCDGTALYLNIVG